MARELCWRPEDLPRSGAINYIIDALQGKPYPLLPQDLLELRGRGQPELSVELSHALPNGLSGLRFHLLYVDKFAVRGARHAHNQAASAEVPVIRVRQQDVLVPDGASLHGEIAHGVGQAQEPGTSRTGSVISTSVRISFQSEGKLLST